jgi:hypothetical protein
MSNARLRLAFAGDRTNGNHVSSCEASFFLRSWGGSWLTLEEPPGSPRPPPLVRFADKALRAFPTPLHAHGPRTGP